MARPQPSRLASTEAKMLVSSSLVTATTVSAERMLASSSTSLSSASPCRTTAASPSRRQTRPARPPPRPLTTTDRRVRVRLPRPLRVGRVAGQDHGGVAEPPRDVLGPLPAVLDHLEGHARRLAPAGLGEVRAIGRAA